MNTHNSIGEQLKEASKYLALFGGILYIFGFITISAFLARFGILSFDIVNARFIIAGILVFVSSLLVVVVVLVVYKPFAGNLPFSEEKILDRVGAHLTTLSLCFGFSLALQSLFDLGNYTVPWNPNWVRFSPFEIDYVGKCVTRLFNLKNTSLDYISKLWITLACYCALGVVIYLIYSVWKRRRSGATHNIQDSDKTASSAVPSEESRQRVELFLGILRQILIFILRLVEALCITLVVSLLIWAFIKIRISLIDFHSLADTKLTDGLVFAWFFTYTLALLFLLLRLGMAKHKNLSDFLSYIKEKMHLIPFIIQTGLVPVIAAVFLFGQTIYPRIPYAMGGGQPREIYMKTRDTTLTYNKNAKIYLLGESSDYVFVVINDVAGSRAVQVNKDLVEYIQTRTQIVADTITLHADVSDTANITKIDTNSCKK